MDSLFFNITDTSYKVSNLYKNKKEYIQKVDISNGILYYDIYLNSLHVDEFFHIKNLDRLVAIVVSKKGNFKVVDNKTKSSYNITENSINIFVSSRQDLSFIIKNEVEIFVVFVADFILKRYLSSNKNEVINYLYYSVQGEVTCRHIANQPIDALSLHVINKILNTKEDNLMNSIKSEYNVLEFMIHRFSLLDMKNDDLTDCEMCISKSAKDILLKTYVNPPNIEQLAHLCATNETKLKQVFKKAYKITIYGYIQKLRLEKANLLLREKYSSIGDIAKEVGYKHQGYFSKLFFENYGVYPKDLLKNNSSSAKIKFL